MQSTPRLGSATGRLGHVKAGALILVIATAAGAAACGAAGPSGTVSAAAVTQQTSIPVPPGLAVTCGPGQQALVRQHAVNGQAMTAVECVPAAGAIVGMPSASPAAWTPTAQVVYADAPMAVASARARPASYVTERDVVTYRPRARKASRSVQESVLIIGSSAGIGAGVGAAIGGKKGALIGAAIGGGGATIWDQVTRRR